MTTRGTPADAGVPLVVSARGALDRRCGRLYLDGAHLPAPPCRMTHLESSRAFVDTVGLAWVVREIATPTLSPALARMLEHDRRRGGWLVFESAEGERRRLAPYPPDWRTMTDFEIERWCMRAAPVPPAPERRAVDQQGSDTDEGA